MQGEIQGSECRAELSGANVEGQQGQLVCEANDCFEAETRERKRKRNEGQFVCKKQ